MAYDDDQNEFPLPGGKPTKRKSSQHLPRYFRTQTNDKFLSSTLDQLIQPGVAEKLSGYFGRKYAKAYNINDDYIGDVSDSRENYQLEPSSVIKDDIGNVTWYKDYNDYINQIKNLSGNTDNHSILNGQEYYAWDPKIDWDKFANFREYYWLPNGPQSVPIRGQDSDTQSVYTVSFANNGNNYAFVFSPDGLTQNPTLTLYRGIKYTFDILTPALPLSFKTRRSLDTQYNLAGAASAVEDGIIEFTLDANTPNNLYYVSDNDINASGSIIVKDIEESAFIDVEKDIIGKRSYTTSAGYDLTNGMKVYFQGSTNPAKYATGEWYVEGVGDKIRLISAEDLSIPSSFAGNLPIKFDSDGFDNQGFSTVLGYPSQKDYIVINRASLDGNLWTRYNRWFHKSVIEKSAEINNIILDLDQNQRANRPIIEFEAGLKLYNFGTFAKQKVDLVDDFTTDAFSTVEGSTGYSIDNTTLTEGMRVVFLNDPDPLVKNRIFQVKFIEFADNDYDLTQISLIETEDSLPTVNENIIVSNGDVYGGKILYFNGITWKLTQEKTSVNQSPLFDVFDSDGIELDNPSVYEASTFNGTKFFSYAQGIGNNDSELGFPISYRSIANIGDIVFDFNYNEDSIQYQEDNAPISKKVNSGFLKQYSSIDSFDFVNGYTVAPALSEQPVIRQYVVDNTYNTYDIDVYDNSNQLTDLWLRVYKNNVRLYENVDYTLQNSANGYKTLLFTLPLNLGDNIILKTKSATPKNENGFYEIPANLEKNPLNGDVSTFTLGEVNDHVASIIENTDDFVGIYPGVSNLRDLKNLSQYGKTFIKHSCPHNLSSYHLLETDSNIISALKYSRREYGKFKRRFFQVAEELGYEGPVKEHLDKVFQEINKDKTQSDSFYFTDMLPLGGAKKLSFIVEDDEQVFFPLSQPFDLSIPSIKTVQVYLNGTQLIREIDYTFTSEGFCNIATAKQRGDTVDIYEYETTNASFVPATPTKLGLYPAYVPRKYIDDTFIDPTEVIQGHDGSIFVTYGDFRDDLVLELEKRIYNNLRIPYDVDTLNIHSFIPGEYRSNGIHRQSIDNSTISDFIQWQSLLDVDYTENTGYERSNSFTWNYSNMTSPNNNTLPGYWRRIYQDAYDTDRPHTAPWEMLGFYVKPSWWEEQYGKAPYTSNNLLMWEDLENGIIREPNKPFVQNTKYSRPGLLSHLPVDEDGNLLSPSVSGYAQNIITTEINKPFVFGDSGPVESAWRRSSEYPFALLIAWALNKPNTLFALGFDRIRQKKNILGQIDYTTIENKIKLSEIVFPNDADDAPANRIFTSGLVNYIYDFMAAKVTTPFTQYKTHVANISNQLGIKIGGYTEKSKFRFILDSRTPLNQGNVFVPDENYSIFLNKSTPVDVISYSGVIIEKLSNGYSVRGYDNFTTTFKYFKPIALDNDPVVNVGGISEPFSLWDSGKRYNSGNIVEYENSYYRVTNNHVSGETFENGNFAKLPDLPKIGGREAVFHNKEFEQVESEVQYGTIFKSIQEVVDFLFGLERYYTQKGLVFDKVNDDGLVENFSYSAKEFMFWTTQNWGQGSVITVSPASNRIKFVSKYSVVDDVFTGLYGYTLLKSDGKKLVEEFSRIGRSDPNVFVLEPKNTADGIYNIKLPLVQKEHVVLFDNTSVFGDVIYDIEPGYRQERLKVLGYRTDEWDGSLNIPGFVFDNVVVKTWEQWKDYSIGDVVKYKEFYYTANKKIPGSSDFQSDLWYRLAEEPKAGLLTNFDYKINQFADFYDLDSDNFDTEQQRLAQHLIGYQKRDYLENIINDDVSQYKFYQGMIQDKGTKNALTKLFDVLGSADRDSLEFYEEWAIKVGQYGAAEGFDEVEYILDESKFRLSPQPIELVDRITGDEKDLVFRILPFETYLKPDNYDHSPFPTKYISKGYLRDSGYVFPEDIDFEVSSIDEILNLNFADVAEGSYVWTGNIKNKWSVLRHTRTDYAVESIARSNQSEIEITLDSTPTDLAKNDVIGLLNAPNEKFFKVVSCINNIVTVLDEDEEAVENLSGVITKFTNARVSSLENANSLSETLSEKDDLIWLDDNREGKWEVLKNTSPFRYLDKVENFEAGSNPDILHNYAESFSVDNRNSVLVVGAPDNEDGKVFVYTRASNANTWQYLQTLEAESTVADALQRFGKSVSVSPDGAFILVGSPEASNVKSRFRGEYDTVADYEQGTIVEYNELLWRALVDVEGEETNIEFTSFDSAAQIIENAGLIDRGDEKVYTLLTGNYPFTDIDADHMLIRAPRDMYQGSGENFDLELKWNTLSKAYQDQLTLTATEPFAGNVPAITSSVINNGFRIQKKIDAILYIQAYTTNPAVGTRVQSVGVEGTVAYTYAKEGQLTVYISDINGQFEKTGSLTVITGEFIGEFDRVGPNETVDVSDYYSGYWYVDVPTYSITDTTFDEGRGLVYKNVSTDSTLITTPSEDYYNILDIQTTQQSSNNYRYSEITTLSFTGIGAGSLSVSTESNLYGIRVPKTLSDDLTVISPGDSGNSRLGLYKPLFPRYYIDLSTPLENLVYYSIYKNGVRVDDENFGNALQTNENAVTRGITGSGQTRLFFDEIGVSLGPIDELQIQKEVDGSIVLTTKQYENVLQDINLPYTDFNRVQPVYDVWDGYITVNYLKTNPVTGEPIVPKVGQTIRVVTTDPIPSRPTGEVAYVWRDDLAFTIFLKNITGTWPLGAEAGDNKEIDLIAIPGDADPNYTVNQLNQAAIQNASLGSDPDDIGKFVVFETQSGNRSVPDQNRILESEYWIYYEEARFGIPRSPNIPSILNNDWEIVNRIPTDSAGTASGLTNEGFVTIFRREGSAGYSSDGGFITPLQENNGQFGNDIKITKFNDLYQSFIHSKREQVRSKSGRLWFINNGVDKQGIVYNWSLAKNPSYRGEFDNARTYREGNIVFYDGILYSAITNLSAGEFNVNNWAQLENLTDYVGYVPNETPLVLDTSVLGSLDLDTSSVIDNDYLYDFGSAYDISQNGDVLVVSAKYTSEDRNRVFVYRSQNGAFLLSQTIFAENNTIGFGETIAISQDGNLLAVGCPFDDTRNLDQGKILVYKLSNGEFVLSQTLHSRNNERAENFGSALDFDGKTLFVGAVYADSQIETTFDTNSTVFDNSFTQFKTFDTNSGVVYVYDNIKDLLVYGQTLDFDDTRLSFFGRKIVAKGNHVYVGINRYVVETDVEGIVLDYRKPESSKIWETHRQSKDTVDVNKIKRVILYDRKQNKIIDNLDYIDPLQGKIAGIAEQELRYKTYFDPAVYTTGTSSVVVDSSKSWDETQVGQLWWDLTNAKFYNPYQEDILFSTNNWNRLYQDASIDVYEWVESDYLPSEYDSLAGTQEGLTLGITGLSKYGDNVYVTRQEYDSVAEKFVNKYYFWVKDKSTLPNIESRYLPAKEVANLIADPVGAGYRFVAFVNDSSFILFNCEPVVKSQDIVFSVQYWTIENQDINIHNEYQILTEGLATSKPKRDIESKWIDSLVGYDSLVRPVPDPTLSEKEKYGILQKPRQGWFRNREEALKQVIERTNTVLRNTLLADDKDLTAISQKDPLPQASDRTFDVTVDTVADLDLVGVARARQASLDLVVVDGKITRVDILDSGRGYTVSPTFEILTQTGAGAELDITINNQGSITSVEVLQQGNNYLENDVIVVRKFTALVEADSSIQGKWALYERIAETRSWSRTASQAYDVTLYWDYIDWYAQGYSEYTNIDFLIDQSYELQTINDNIGDIIKIATIGTGGWLLLEKIDNQITPDYSINYETVGRQNGTIRFNTNLYNVLENRSGFDSQGYDSLYFDPNPNAETRIIMESIRDDLLVDELEVEYNKLFFSSIKYVLSEQLYVDWLFKTSFVKAKHNTGELEQRTTYQNDNLNNYEDYLLEVKPYKTKLREYVSDYEKLDSNPNMVTDFDLPPVYNNTFNSISPIPTKAIDNVVVSDSSFTDVYPYKHWTDNNTFEVVEVLIGDEGQGYLSKPKLTVSGGGGTGAVVEASLGSNGKIASVTVINPGSGYTSAPAIAINGTLQDSGTEARLVAKIGNPLVRSTNSIIKFDRVSGRLDVTNINEVETFTSTGLQKTFTLTWPMDLQTTTVELRVNNDLLLQSQYSYSNILKTVNGVERYFGYIELNDFPANEATVQVTYKRNISILKAQDRINLAYNPATGQLPNDLAQLMDGVDYGGVNITSFDFGTKEGWDQEGWFTDAWDAYDENSEDKSFTFANQTVDIFIKDDGPNYGYKVQPVPRPIGEILDNSALINPELTLYQGLVYTLNVDIEADSNVAQQIAEATAVIDDGGITSPLSYVFDGQTLSTEMTLETAETFIANFNAYALSIRTENSVASASDYFTDISITGTDSTSGYPVYQGSITIDLTGDNVPDTLYYMSSNFSSLDGGKVNIAKFLQLDEVLENGVTYNVYKNQVRIDDPNFHSETFTTDGSTSVFVLSRPFKDGITYGVYINDVRVDDPNVGTADPISNPYAIIQTPVGDGVIDFVDFAGVWDSTPSTVLIKALDTTTANPQTRTIIGDGVSDKIFFSDLEFVPTDGDTITIRKETSDGTILPSADDYDTLLTGGNLLYTNATGISASDINIDGDGFVTPISSKGPEETVPGHVLDTLDIQVYERETGGTGAFAVNNYIGDGSTKTFDIAITPYQNTGVFVKVNYQISNTYTVDLTKQQITFNTAPANNSKISIVSQNLSGSSLLDTDTFIGDGSTNVFLTNLRYESNLTAFVTVNGVQRDVEIFESDNTLEVSGNIALRFANTPSNNSLIQFAVFDNPTQSFSQIVIDQFVADGSTVEFALNQSIFTQQPVSYNTVVTVNNNVLNAGYSQVYSVTTAQREYQLDLWQIPVESTNANDIEVYLNGRLLEYVTEWQYEGASLQDQSITLNDEQDTVGSTVVLNAGIGEDGDELRVYVITDGEYRFGYFDTGNEFVNTSGLDSTVAALYLDNAYNDGDIIRVYQWSNHDSLGIDRQGYDVVERTTLTVGEENYFRLRKLRNGVIRLRQPAVETEYVWIGLDGKWLKPNVDYTLLDDKQTIKFTDELAEGSVVDIVHFAGTPARNKFGWRQFKDMLNRTHYKRLDGSRKYYLAQPLNWFDQEIVLTDSSNLPEPNVTERIPGVMFIDGERIEYFRKDGNNLRQIRRGTLGTGVKDIYETGTALYEQGPSQTMPYRDEEETFSVTSGGYSDASTIYENSENITFESLTYSFNFNRAFPASGFDQIATVTGTGFRDQVKVFVGVTDPSTGTSSLQEMTTTFVSTTELTFETVGNPVGSYDMVIVNPVEVFPVDRPQEALVVPGAIKYTQILMPFAPLPNIETAQDWATTREQREALGLENNLPSIYREAKNIEVFVGGTRLRKNPIQSYIGTAQDSPEGDIPLEAEFAANETIGNYVRLSIPPAPGLRIDVVRKKFTEWSEPGTPLALADNEISSFLRARTIDLPR